MCGGFHRRVAEGAPAIFPREATLAFATGLGLTSQAMAIDPSSPASAQRGPIFFDRREFDRLLRLYGQKVAAGEWRDYGVASLADACVFSVFRRAGEAPYYRIEKRPALARRQGAWAIIGQGGMVLKRGHELEQVLRYFDKGRLKVVE